MREGGVQVIMRFMSEPLRLLPPPLLQRAVRCLQLQQFEQHGTAYVAGDEPAALYIVLSGAAPLLNKRRSDMKRTTAPERDLIRCACQWGKTCTDSDHVMPQAR